jgi:glycosyltransferase involved in cell wall biosynthesis
VDNGSKDRSRAIAEAVGYPVRVIDEPAPGAARARNAGVRAATGEFIAFLDADDLWESGKLARQVEILDAEPEVDLVFTHVRDFISPELTDVQRATLSGRTEDYAAMLPSTMLARTQRMHAAGPLPDIAIGEFIAWFGLAQVAGLKWRMLPESLVQRRMHLNNLTRRRREDMGGYIRAAKLVLDSRRSRNSPENV